MPLLPFSSAPATGAGTGTVTNIATTSPIAGGPITTTGTLTFTAQPLLSTTLCSDVTAGTVARGDVITGQGATPKWTRLAKGAANTVLAMDATGTDVVWATAGTGTVTSVDMSVPSILSISGNPVTTSGTLAVTLANENANTIFAGPSSGAAAAPTFRAMTIADMAASTVFVTTTRDDGSAFGNTTNNTIRLIGVYFPSRVTASNVFLHRNAASGANLTSVGLYDSSGALVWATAASTTDWNGTGHTTVAFSGGSTSWGPGKYYFAVTSAAATFRVEAGTSNYTWLTATNSVTGSASGAMPSSITIPADSIGYNGVIFGCK